MYSGMYETMTDMEVDANVNVNVMSMSISWSRSFLVAAVAAWCKQVLLLGLVVAQMFISLQPARHYWNFMESLASKSAGLGFPNQPLLYVDLPVIGNGVTSEGEKASSRPQIHTVLYILWFVHSCWWFGAVWHGKYVLTVGMYNTLLP